MDIYKQKYEQALENLKKIKNANKDNKELLDFIEYQYPELKESEDEKWRNWLIGHLKGYINQTDDKYANVCKKAISWLEKQGEKIDKLVEYREWLISETERWYEKENDKTNSNAGKHCCIGAANAFISARAEFEEIFDYESWPEKQGEQTSAWSEEDKKNYNTILNLIRDSGTSAQLANRLSDWLQSLKQRMKGE